MRLHSILRAVPFLAATLVLALAGCESLRQLKLGIEALTSKVKPDYDVVEADRERQRGPEEASDLTLENSDFWTGFRGPIRDGNYSDRPVRLDWPAEGLPVVWRQPIGGGYSSFAIAQGLAYTLEQRREQETVVAYELTTGREVWTYTYDARFSEAFSGEGPRATPTYTAGRLYSVGATGEVHCLDAVNGDLIWRRNVLVDTGAENLNYGVSASPLVSSEMVIVIAGAGTDKNSVVAYELETGDVLWSALPEEAAYASPMKVHLGGRDQILVATANRVVGLDPYRGELLWEYPWQVFSGLACAQPVLVDSNRVFVSGSYGAGCALLQIGAPEAAVATAADSEGDNETAPSALPLTARLVWENKTLRNKFNSSIYYNGHLYGLDEGIFVCLDAETGKRRWKGGRYGYGQVTLVGEHLIVSGGKGDLALLRATPERHEELARFNVFKGNSWTPPALASSLLVMRNAAEMVCLDLRIDSESSESP